MDESKGMMGVCEVCGEPAVQITRDTKEIELDDGTTTWVADGELHRRCAKHKRMPKETRLDGTAWGGWNLDGESMPARGVAGQMAQVMREFAPDKGAE